MQYGRVRNGTVPSDTAQYGKARYGMDGTVHTMRLDMVWSGMTVRCGTSGTYGTVRWVPSNTARDGPVQYGRVRDGAIGSDTVRHGELRYLVYIPCHMGS